MDDTQLAHQFDRLHDKIDALSGRVAERFASIEADAAAHKADDRGKHRLYMILFALALAGTAAGGAIERLLH